MRALDPEKSRASVRIHAPVAQRTEQRFPKRNQAVTVGRCSTNRASPTDDSLKTVTSSLGLCAPVDDHDEYQGKRLRPLWDLALRLNNHVLRRLVLQYEVQHEGVAIVGGRLA